MNSTKSGLRPSCSAGWVGGWVGGGRRVEESCASAGGGSGSGERRRACDVEGTAAAIRQAPRPPGPQAPGHPLPPSRPGGSTRRRRRWPPAAPGPQQSGCTAGRGWGSAGPRWRPARAGRRRRAGGQGSARPAFCGMLCTHAGDSPSQAQGQCTRPAGCAVCCLLLRASAAHLGGRGGDQRQQGGGDQTLHGGWCCRQHEGRSLVAGEGLARMLGCTCRCGRPAACGDCAARAARNWPWRQGTGASVRAMGRPTAAEPPLQPQSQLFTQRPTGRSRPESCRPPIGGQPSATHLGRSLLLAGASPLSVNEAMQAAEASVQARAPGDGAAGAAACAARQHTTRYGIPARRALPTELWRGV